MGRTGRGWRAVRRARVMVAGVMVAGGVLGGTARAQAVKEFVFAVGSTSFPSSHASTVVELKDGRVRAAWFGGSAEGKPDVACYTAVRDGVGWSKPVEVVREPGIACYNPVLFHTQDGKLWLYYKYGPNPAEWSGARKWSADEGATWSKADYLPAGLLGPIRAKPLVEADGTIVSGTSFESYREWAVWIERSTDGGGTWAKIGPIVPPESAYRRVGNGPGEVPDTPGSVDWKYIRGIIQPSVVELRPGHLRLYARSTSLLGKVVVSDSTDNGVTWTEGRPLEVPNPNSGIDAVAMRDGRVALVYNDTAGTARTPLNVAVSADGLHFKNVLTLESEPGEFSYPAMVQARNGDLLITYTWNRKTIRYARVTEAELLGR